MSKVTKRKKQLTTYEEHQKSLTSKQRQEFENEYQELVLSELVLAIMAQDDISVRKLARIAGISPTIVQDVRSGKKVNLTLSTFIKILNALHCSLVIERERKDSSSVMRLAVPTMRVVPPIQVPAEQLVAKNRK